MNWELAAKRLGLLHELLPAGNRFGALVNFNGTYAKVVEPFIKDVQTAVARIDREIEVINACRLCGARAETR